MRIAPLRTMPLLGSVVVVLTTAVLASPAVAARPDLAVSTVSSAPTSLTPGQSFHAADKTTDRGAATAPASRTAYYLSHSARRTSDALRLGDRPLTRLKPKHSSSGGATLSPPAFTPSGSYFLIACADDKRRVAESNERNNCHSAGTQMTIVAAQTVIPAPTTGDETPSTPAPAAGGTSEPVTDGSTSGSTTPASDTTPPTFAGASGVDQPTATSLRVTWAAANDSVTPADQITYLVCWSSSASACSTTFTSMATTPAGATSYTATGLNAGTIYYFVVRARDAAGNVDSNTVVRSGNTTDLVPPTFAGASQVNQRGTADSLDVLWSAAADNVSPADQITYKVCWSTSASACSSSFTSMATTPAGATSYTATGLNSGTTYYFVVRARDAAGNVDSNTVVRSNNSCYVHVNGTVAQGLGQTYTDCHPLGTPGDGTTYTAAMAQEAAAAWPASGTVTTGTCGATGNVASIVIKQTTTSAAVWVYSGTGTAAALAGHVYVNNGSNTPMCPAASDPTWN